MWYEYKIMYLNKKGKWVKRQMSLSSRQELVIGHEHVGHGMYFKPIALLAVYDASGERIA